MQLKELTLKELRAKAKSKGIKGYSSLKQKELIKLIQSKRGGTLTDGNQGEILEESNIQSLPLEILEKIFKELNYKTTAAVSGTVSSFHSIVQNKLTPIQDLNKTFVKIITFLNRINKKIEEDFEKSDDFEFSQADTLSIYLIYAKEKVNDVNELVVLNSCVITTVKKDANEMKNEFIPNSHLCNSNKFYYPHITEHFGTNKIMEVRIRNSKSETIYTEVANNLKTQVTPEALENKFILDKKDYGKLFAAYIRKFIFENNKLQL